MAAEANLDAFLARLDDPNQDLKIKCAAATELRDSIDGWCQVGPQMYSIFLKKSIPVFLKLLEGPPVFISTSPEQRLRGCIFEILHRLPMTPTNVTEPYAAQLVDRLMELVRIENEDNDILVVKTIMDILRGHQGTLKDRVQPFLDIILEMFQMMDRTVKELFDNPAQTSATAVPSTPGNQYSQSPRPGSPVSTVSTEIGNEQQQTRQLQKGMQSFKVLSECPIIVVSIFTTTDRALVAKNVKVFVPQIKNTLMLQAKPQEKAHEEAKARKDIHTGVCKEIKNRAAFGDFILMQVKTMSFLAYLLRVYAQQLTDFLPSLPDIIIRLLKDCPRERSAARKELLVAIRHIINFNFRKIFLKKIDELLEARILIGDGLTVYETMRPLAYSMLADLIHHLRDVLDKDQIRKTIEVYTKNLHDDYPGTSFQTMSAKLLLNMADWIAKVEPKQDARYFLMMILNAIADKFAAMNHQFDNKVKISNQSSGPSPELVTENYLADKEHPPEWDEIDIFNAAPIKTQNPRERGSDPVNDNKFLFKNLLQGLKNLFIQLRNTNPAKLKEETEPTAFPGNWSELSFGYTAEETQVFIKLFHEGCKVFRYYGTGSTSLETQTLTTGELLANQHMLTGGKDEKELLEAFAAVFHHIDPATFHEIFQSEIPFLYDMCFEHSPLLHVAQFLLASEATSPHFCGMLMQFLMGRIEEIGSSDVKKASILLRLFKLSFMAVTLFAPQNEQILLPHVTKIMTQAIQLSTTAEEPMNYFLLLRSLFRSIGGGRFEHLYKELLPLLEMLLDVLNNLLHAARKSSDRDLFVELILTVPARLSNLLPHLSYLMRPLVVALSSGTDLVGQGLRTLELCVDNLTADYIDPIMAPVIDELMTALWDHLKPAPYQHFHSHTTMRILGKLGGRNRKFLNGLPPLEYKSYSDDQWTFDVKLIGTTRDRAFPASIGVDLAIAKLKEDPSKLRDATKIPAAKASDAFHKRQAYKYIQSQIKLFIGLDSLPEDFAQLVRLQATDLLSGKFDVGEDTLTASERERSYVKRDAEQETFSRLLQACHYVQAIPELKEEGAAFSKNLCRHFMLLEIGKTFATYKHRQKPFDIRSGEGPLYIDSRVMADAIAESLASDCIEEREAAEASIQAMWDAAAIILGKREQVDKMPFFVHLLRNFTHNCHQEEWFVKTGGVLGIKIIVTRLPFGDPWMLHQHPEIVRALMYVLKDMPPDLTARPRLDAEEIMETLIRRIAKTFSKDDLSKPATNTSKFLALNKLLIQELSHMNKHVRQASQKMYKILSEILEVDIGEIIAPVKDILLQPVFNKPLRALPFGLQIGNVDAMTFIMKLPGNLIPHDDQLNRLVLEAMFLADAEDDALTTKPTEFRNAESIVQLRVGCLKLLSIALTYPEYSSMPPTATWNKVICVFFKCLYMKSPEVVEAANTALKSVISVTNKLPKDILQNGLRPILTNLQYPQKLSVDGLEGLARLLKLLTNYFKVEIGARLLDHTKIFAEPGTLQRVSFNLIEQSRPMRVITAVINIYHLLPPAALQFLGPLVNKVIELETALRRTMFSPFREPLIRFMNQYAKETWDYFAPKLHDMIQGRFFAQILSHPHAGPLREAVVNDASGLYNFTTKANVTEKSIACINAIHAANAICQYPKTRSLLVKNEELRKSLFETAQILESQRRTYEIDSSLRLAAEQAGGQVMELFTIYLEQEPNDFEFFFELADMATAGRLKLCPSLYKFIYGTMICSESVEYWRNLVFKCIAQYRRGTTPQRAKTFLFHYVVNPIFAMDIKRNWDMLFGNTKGTKLLDKSMINMVHEQLWKPNLLSDGVEEASVWVDHSRMELLQLTALFLKYHSHSFQETRKDIIKFCWAWIKLEDVVNKHAAYVVIAYFIQFYETPAKIAMTVYQFLLKAHQNEGRPLVTQALELLAPVLKKRVGSLDQHKLPLWARMPKRIIAEETHNLQQLICIFNFFCRQADLFYEARDALAASIIPNLQKIATSNEGRKTSLNLAALVWEWEERSYNESRSPSSSPQGTKRKIDGATVQTQKPFTMVTSTPLRLIMIKYLAQFVSALQERYPVPSAQLRATFPPPVHPPAATSEFCRKAVRLLHNFLTPPFWSELDIDPLLPKVLRMPLTTEKATEDKQEGYDTKLINTLQVLKVFVNIKSDDWVLDNINDLWKLIERTIKMEDAQIQDSLHFGWDEKDEKDMKMSPLFRRLLDVLPDPPPTEDEPEETPTSEFMTSVHTVITDAFTNGNLIVAINILATVCKAKPKEVDQHIPALMKALTGKLIKDHFAQQSPTPQAPQSARPDGPVNPMASPLYDTAIQTGLILKLIDILEDRIEALGEQRRPFLSALASLVERSRNEAVCMKVLDLAEAWIFHSDGVPTLKEKVAVVTKMLFFENRPEMAPQLKRFLDLVLKVYEDKGVRRTELTVRLEHPFMIGTRAQDVEIRNKFLSLFDKNVSRTPNTRFETLLTGQDWAPLFESFWLSQVIHLLFGSLEMSAPVQLHKDDFKTMSPMATFGTFAKDPRLADVMVDDQLESFMDDYRRFCGLVADVKLRDLMEPLTQLQHTDKDLAAEIWIAIFPIFWANVPKDDRPEAEANIANLLTKDYHMRQLDHRPNCVQTLLEGVVRAKPRMKCPPHVVKFLAKTYNAWYTAAVYLEDAAVHPLVDTPAVRESTLDALLEVYSSLEETDMFYGTWRRRCQYVETNAALSYEQIGMWDKSQQMYEAAQIKARTGSLPFSPGEYQLWEDHWVICAQKLQQWDILAEYARTDNLNDLYIDSMWRNAEHWTDPKDRETFDSIIKGLSDGPTPRRAFFQAFMGFLKMHYKVESVQDFSRNVDEAIQLSIRKWHQLPKRVTNAHIPLLQQFQHLVELYDAQLITNALSNTNLANLDHKSQELKMLFGSWRDRLPNFWDDINAWQDLVTWRTHVFTLVNNTFLPIIQPGAGNQQNPAQNSFAYRGYHEMAWIINRFAHVARQHNLPEVCISQLSKIYTLPNIEIQEAFLKLREQAKCHYQNKAELNSGLDVINNTNLNYFGQQQKAEFYTLKGMFLNKLGQKTEANEAFGSALYFDIKLPKAWAEWGRYNDMLFKQDPKDIDKASSAVSCYLEAASLFKDPKTRKLLGRILWLLSLDNTDRVLSTAFGEFKGETPVWYWITFIPQLISGLSRLEAPIARSILNKIAKAYPQALFFQLRTSKEDMMTIKRQQEMKDARERQAKANQDKTKGGAAGSPGANASQTSPKPNSTPSRPNTANGTQVDGENGLSATPNNNATGSSSSPAKPDVEMTDVNGTASATTNSDAPLKPWEHVDQVMNSLKSSFPLLAWSMESMVDQITKHFKSMPDEDAHRLIVALLNDGLSYVGRQPGLYAQDVKLPVATEQNISRFAESVCPPHIRKSFEADFVKVKPTMHEYIQKLRKWRNRFEEKLDRRATPVPLEGVSSHLSEFRFQKFDDVEVPGQYLQHKDKNSDFIRIERIMPDVDLIRGSHVCHRRLKIRGHDGSVHPFAVQHPTGRYCRREERILQLFRLFNETLQKRRETRRRNLQFNLPVMVPLSPAVRIIADDASYVTLQTVYEDFCRQNNMQKEDPILYQIEKLRALAPKNVEQMNAIRLESFISIQENMVPPTVAIDYFQATYPSYADFWLFRRAFSYQFAALTFITYIMYMNSRYPHKLNISRDSGRVWGTELVPTMGAQRPIFNNTDTVPFRLSPNLQRLMGPIVTEGIFAPALMAIARCLMEPEGELEMELSVFVRDEVMFWYTQQRHASPPANMLRESVQVNSELVIRRAKSLAQPPESGNLPANQTVVDLVANAVNPKHLSTTDPLWMAWL